MESELSFSTGCNPEPKGRSSLWGDVEISHPRRWVTLENVIRSEGKEGDSNKDLVRELFSVCLFPLKNKKSTKDLYFFTSLHI